MNNHHLIYLVKFHRNLQLTILATRSSNNDKVPFFIIKNNFFKFQFFPSIIIEWNKVDLNIRDSSPSMTFKV